MNGQLFVFSFDAATWAALLPAVVLAAGGLLIILLDAFVPIARRTMPGLAALAGIGTLLALGRAPHGRFLGNTLESSPLTAYLGALFALVTIIVAFIASQYLEREGIAGGEFYALLLWASCGMLLMVQGLDLLIVFIGLELLSISLYVLAGYHTRVPAAAEAALKYFIMGSFASAFILYGIALTYGTTGTTNLLVMGRMSARGVLDSGPLLALAAVFMVAGLAFKLALVPFHAWAPDVYQGAPTPVTAFFTVGPKAAAAVVLMRVLAEVFAARMPGSWTALLAGLAIASMTLGNLVALAQRDIKRMLAYSGVAHMGYLLLALVVLAPGQHFSQTAALVYVFTYAFMNLGAFAVIAIVYRGEAEPHLVQSLAGLARRRPFLGFALAVFMISLGGIPPTAGFIGKLLVFRAAIENGFVWLAIAGVLNSLIALGYYLRVVFVVYMKEPAAARTPADVPGLLPPAPPALADVPATPFSLAAVVLSLAGVIGFGLYPLPLVTWAELAAQALVER